MAEREEIEDPTTPIPEHLVETILKLSRTSRQMLQEIGREPSAAATVSRDSSTMRRARRPAACSDEAFPTSCSSEATVAAASGTIGVVAA